MENGMEREFNPDFKLAISSPASSSSNISSSLSPGFTNRKAVVRNKCVCVCLCVEAFCKQWDTKY